MHVEARTSLLAAEHADPEIAIIGFANGLPDVSSEIESIAAVFPSQVMNCCGT